MNRRRIDCGAVTLAIAEAGAGGRPFLLVHGFGGAKEDFTDFLDPLADLGFHAVAPDLRGHGASDHPPGVGAYSLDVFAADVAALATALGWTAFVLLGHSMGGMVAQGVALTRPEVVTALVLMDTAHGPMDWLDPDLLAMAAAIIRDDGVDAFVDLTAALRDDDPLATPAFRRLVAERPGYAEFVDRKARATSADMRLAMMPAFTSQAARLDALRAVRAPTLVIAGEQDAGFLRHSREMAAAIPDARLVVVPDAGHSPQFENADAWWAALRDFLEGLPT